jgi:putative OPT family oligopeptide transporter
MTIGALLGTASLLLVFGYTGRSAILATLGVAAVVCSAACSAGDVSQDLKTGYLVGATPRLQQWGEIIGAVVPAFTIAPVLTLLHTTYGIGSRLPAPQATLFASITEGIFGAGKLSYDMVWYGLALGALIILLDAVLRRMGARFRLHVMPLAVGIYLPLTLSVPILVGGVIRALADHKNAPQADERQAHDPGILFSSGLIAGEAIMGVLLAVAIYVGLSLELDVLAPVTGDVVSCAAFAMLAYGLYRTARR